MDDGQYSFLADEGGELKFVLPEDRPTGDNVDSDDISEREAEAQPLNQFPNRISGEHNSARERARKYLLETVRQRGYKAENMDDAWGAIVSVQAEIALDASMGSKATSAAKFLTQAMGIDSAKESQPEDETRNMGREAAQWMLALVEEEKIRRVEDANDEIKA